MELIPLELKLTGYVKIKLGFVKIKFEKDFWHWRAAAIRANIWEKIARKDDNGPPRFPYCDSDWLVSLCHF